MSDSALLSTVASTPVASTPVASTPVVAVATIPADAVASKGGKAAKPAPVLASTETAEMLLVDPRALRIEAGYNPVGRRFDAADKEDKALMLDIQRVGVTQVITVREDRKGRLYVIAGHRRKLACDAIHKAGGDVSKIERVPVRIVQRDGAAPTTEAKVSRIYDIKRSNTGKPLTVLDMAFLVQAAADLGETPRALAFNFGITERYVGNFLVIAAMPESVQAAMRQGRIGASLAHVIVQEFTGPAGKDEALRAKATIEAHAFLTTMLASVPGKITPKVVEDYRAKLALLGAGPDAPVEGADGAGGVAAPAYTAVGCDVVSARGVKACTAVSAQMAERIALALSGKVTAE